MNHVKESNPEAHFGSIHPFPDGSIEQEGKQKPCNAPFELKTVSVFGDNSSEIGKHGAAPMEKRLKR